MSAPIVLASGSETRARLLRAANVSFEIVRPRIDEATIRDALVSDGLSPRDQADTLAEFKARRVSQRFPASYVIGSDQILDLDGISLAKAANLPEARKRLAALRGRSHRLWSAAVIYHDGAAIWRSMGRAELTMLEFSDHYLADYIHRNKDTILHSVGCYLIEAEGLRLFSRVEGDYFSILGMPLLDVLNYLSLRGAIT